MAPLNSLIENVKSAAFDVEIAYARAKRNAGALLHATQGEKARDEIDSLGNDDSIGPLIANEVAVLAKASASLSDACPVPAVPAVQSAPESEPAQTAA